LTQIAGAPPQGLDVINAVIDGMAALETAGRPGSCGLLLHTRLLRVLASPPQAGAAPLVQQIEPIIHSSKIAGTAALSGTSARGETAGILLRLEPPAVDIVHTMPLRVTFLGRVAGQTSLRVEEEIVVRILDQDAIQPLAYS
jgi:hypothetical protein